MRFTKRRLFLVTNSFILAGLLLYFGFWAFSPKVIGDIQHPLQNSTTMIVKYKVGNRLYTSTLLRNGIPFLDTEVTLHYNRWNPAHCRIYSFLGLVAEPMGWWFVFLLASTILLLTNNSVFSKGTIFIFQKKRPWLVVEEFYPVKRWWQQKQAAKDPPPKKGNKNHLLE